MECANTSPAIALNNKESRAGRFFREGEYVRSSCSCIFHKGKDEPARTNNNRTKQNQNLITQGIGPIVITERQATQKT